MIVDSNLFIGEHRFLNVPATGDFEGHVPLPVMTTKAGSGQYTLLLANCNDFGRDVELGGQLIWKSRGGYLPGDLTDEWHFVIFLTFCYAALFGWYGYSMKSNIESTIGIQKWILCTIFLGLLQSFIETADYAKWNVTGIRSNGAMFTCKIHF